MTDVPISNVLPLVNVTATAAQTVFSYPFLIQEAEHLTVIETKDPSGTPVIKTLVQSTDYGTPSAINVDGGGTITLDATAYPSGATAGDQYTLLRKIPIQRLTDFPFRGRFRAGTINTQLDTIFLILQEISRDLGRALILPDEDALSSITLPSKADRLGKVLGFDATNADAIAVTLATTTLAVTSYIETLLDDADAATAQTTLGGTTVGRSVFTAVSEQAGAAALGADHEKIWLAGEIFG